MVASIRPDDKGAHPAPGALRTWFAAPFVPLAPFAPFVPSVPHIVTITLDLPVWGTWCCARERAILGKELFEICKRRNGREVWKLSRCR